MYAWYFPKDISFYGSFGSTKGQRLQWASAVVWLDNPALETPKILAVSTAYPNGGYRILKNAPPACGRWSCDPPFTDYINGSSVMLAYGLEDYYDGSSVTTTTVGSKGELQELIMWEQMTGEARNALSGTDFGDKAKVPFIDANFNASLEAARPFLYL
ncbi:necrosis inducing-like protein NPP1 type [Phytophthora cinnamomi]|uniref:necrosis inducing-like protein NPP1 type n=1 Tax=Phytophthora cinnamomi TaxID=4785 RepID=UPI00355AB5C3|nr:necrosis inducing-like protein NPP1 type [Phytophthora cinnamomi]